LVIRLFTFKKSKIVANQFGDRVRQLREKNNLRLRQVAPLLEMDTPLLSKIERGERTPKKEQVSKLAEILKADNEELLTLWLADQLYDVVKDEDFALKTMQAAEKELINKKKKKD
jgi:HTH-type transcriptional regulator, competence development regulator